MYAIPTAAMAPTIGPTMYTQQSVKSPFARSGPKERAGFIDAPLIGLDQSPASTI